MARRKLTKEQQERKAKRIAKRIDANRQKTIDALVKLMERDGLAYVCEWSKSGNANMLDPQNPITGTHYRGANLANLAVQCMEAGICDNRFATANEARKMGWTIPDDARQFMVEKCKRFTFPVTDKNGNPELDEDGNQKVISYVRPVSYWWVYNYSDLEGTPDLPDAPKLRDVDDETPEVKLIDALKESSRCKVNERKSDGAYYSPTTDTIAIPRREQFSSPQAMLRTLAHEMGHSTSHATACDRKLGGKFGSDEYAFEELIAELTSVFVLSYTGADIVPEDGDGDEAMQRRHENHAAYLKSWLRNFKSDTTYLFRAATKASAAADYIIERLVSAHPEYERVSERIEMPNSDKAA